MKTLFLTWLDPISRSWFPIGRLTNDGKTYQFVYLQGVEAAQQQCGFQGLWSFPDFGKVYESPELFPLFSNRVLRRSRPDYLEFLQWLNIPEHKDDPMTILARSGGQRATDTFEVFPASEPDENGLYHIHFFAHGLQYLPPETVNLISYQKPGELLRLVGPKDRLRQHEVQNPYDRKALMLCTEDQHIVGYCPQYLLDDAFDLQRQHSDQVQVAVERVNPSPTPLQFRLLCQLTAHLPDDFHPFSRPIYLPLADKAALFLIP